MIQRKSWNGITCLCCDKVPEESEIGLEQETDFVQCAIKPSDTYEAKWLTDHGFFFADRRLDVRVKVRDVEEQAKHRFRVDYEIFSSDTEQKNIIDSIFCEAFTHDRRFHLRQHYDSQLASTILGAYREYAENNGMKRLVCKYRDKMVGCMYLQDTKEGYFVYLAAVLPAYQGSGAAIELYQKAVSLCKEQRKMILSGCISSSNTGVMNIYAGFGGSFYGETDIYLYEKK